MCFVHCLANIEQGEGIVDYDLDIFIIISSKVSLMKTPRKMISNTFTSSRKSRYDNGLRSFFSFAIYYCIYSLKLLCF